MKRTVLAFTALALGLTGATGAIAGMSKDGQAQLDKMLEGRTAGKPQSCIPAHFDNRLRVIDKTAVVYDAGKTIYVAKPEHPESLTTDDVLVINRFGSQICRQDVIKTVDRYSGFMSGIVFLGDFVPYEKG